MITQVHQRAVMTLLSSTGMIPHMITTLTDDDGDQDDEHKYKFDARDLASLPLSFGIVGLLWVMLLTVWVAHMLVYRRRYAFPLHRALCALPVVKILASVTAVIHYHDCVSHASGTGDRFVCMRRWTYLLYDLTEMAVLVAVFLILFLISNGYSITRQSFSLQERKGIIWNLSCIAICRAAYSMSPYFVFPMVVMIVVLFGHVFSGIVQNVRMLWTHLVYYRDTFPQQHADSMAELERRTIDVTKDNPAVRKLELFRKFQYLISLGVPLWFLIAVANMIVLSQNMPSLHRAWVALYPLLFEALYLAMAGLLFYVFRLRNFSKYAIFNVVSHQDVENQEIEIVVDNQQETSNREQEMEQEPLLLNLATAPPVQRQAHQGSGDNAPIIVIQNPSYYKPHVGQKRPPAQRAQQVKIFVALQPEDPPLLDES